MAVWSEVDFTKSARASRFDAEYFQPHFLEAEALLDRMSNRIIPLGDLVVDGYRVVYENTEILSEPFDPEHHVKYLQAANISSGFPTIQADGMGWVQRADWERYEKGRVRHGELLVEVKGKAEKVALVPNDFPTEVLVSGTLYKMTLDDLRIDTRYVLIYLLGKFGTSFRDRGKSNILISYVNKDELYAVPIPIAPPEFQALIAQDYLRAEAKHRESQTLYVEAETLLLDALGLKGLHDMHSIAYERNFREVARTGRFDAQYYHPEKYEVLEALESLEGQTIGDYFFSFNDAIDATDDFASNVQNYDLTDALRFFLPDIDPMSISELGSTKKRFRSGDVVVSRLRSYLKEIALVEASSPACVGSTEFIVLRPHPLSNLSPELLLVYLRSEPVQKIVRWCQDGSQHPRFKEQELLSIKLPDRLFVVQDAVKAKVREAIQSFYHAHDLLESAKRRVEQLIEGAT